MCSSHRRSGRRSEQTPGSGSSACPSIASTPASQSGRPTPVRASGRPKWPWPIGVALTFGYQESGALRRSSGRAASATIPLTRLARDRYYSIGPLVGRCATFIQVGRGSVGSVTKEVESAVRPHDGYLVGADFLSSSAPNQCGSRRRRFRASDAKSRCSRSEAEPPSLARNRV